MSPIRRVSQVAKAIAAADRPPSDAPIPPPWFFCHIPKTAGTAFRIQLERNIPQNRLLRDYGPESPTTTPDLQERLEEPPECRSWDMLGGHCRVRRHARLFLPWQMLTFVRHPLQQVISHFEHRTRLQGYTGTLSEFAASQHGIGVIHHYLAPVPLQMLGFVGVTERYEESIALFNACFGLKLVPAKDNVNPDRVEDEYAATADALPEQLRPRLRKENLLFVQANRILDARRAAAQAGRTQWVHGAMTALNAQRVQGMAIDPGSPGRHLPIEVRVDGRRIGLTCTGHPHMPHPAVPGTSLGAIGFQFQFPRALKSGAIVEVRSLEEDQWLDTQIWNGGRGADSFSPPPPGALRD